jgi:hypothetical protein
MENRPSLPVSEWRDTSATLHLWTQVVGKIRLALAPPTPYGARSLQIDFDFTGHELAIRTSDGGEDSLPLQRRSVADFHAELVGRLRPLGFDVRIWTMPVKIADPIPFERDHGPAAQQRDHVHRFWRILVQSEQVMQGFRACFLGKASPPHFFWGSFDLAVTRFSGGSAPPHPGAPNVADLVTREAYSHEVGSCGFWPGGGIVDEPAFYAYAYPQPSSFAAGAVQPDAARYRAALER